MTIDSRHPSTAPKWVDFDLSRLETHPKHGSEVYAEAASGPKGPVTYHARTGFTPFNAPWRELGPVEHWYYRDWSKRSLQQRQG
ncbi:MAG: hypothetical protein ABSF53_05945 [Terracidiphilus sp.]|jgi:hypothetical protein